jgi:TolB-like protein
MNNSQITLEELNSDEIQAQLRVILSSPDFQKKPQLGKFLEFVVTEALAGRQSQVKQYSVAVRAFGWDADFDPQTDPIVRIEARRLRRALDRYYREVGIANPIKITIPLGTYVPEFSKRKFSETSDTVDEQVLKIDPLKAVQLPKVAVLPFTNLAPDELDNYVVNGIGEEISSNLARFQELSVIAFYSMRQFQGGEANIQEIGEQLGISYLVTGSIRVTVDSVRVVVSLVQFPSQEQLWSQIYNREIADITVFEILDEIVEQIIAIIGSGQGVILRNVAQASKHPQPKNFTVLDAISRYYESQWNFDTDSFQTIPAALEKATEIDPENALVWAVLGEIYTDFHVHQDPLIKNALERAEKCAAKALNLDPLCQHAHHLKAYIALQKGDIDAVVEACNRVVELNPNNSYLIGLAGFWLALVGKYEAGKIILRRAMELNPYYPPYFHHAFFLDHYRKGEYLPALAEAEKFIMPEYYWDPLDKAIALSALGRISEAQQKLSELQHLTPNFDANPDEFLSAFVLDDHLRRDMLVNLSKIGLTIDSSD